MKHLLYFDVEWANPKNKSICQMGLMSEDYETGDPVYPELDLYINPDDGFDNMCVNVHHINESKVKDEPTFNEVWPKIRKYFSNSVVVGHNVQGSDLDALIKNLKRYDLDIPVIFYIDTYEIARRFVSPAVCSHDLSSLCAFYGIDIDSEHNAFDDACACSDLLKILIEEFNINIDDFVHKYDADKFYEFEKYACKSKIRFDLNTLLGHVVGFKMDNKITEEEKEILYSYLNKYDSINNDPDVSSIFEVLRDILSDGIVTIDEIKRLETALIYYSYSIQGSVETLATQKLQGILNGLIADQELNETELLSLQQWIYQNDYLKGHYPYDVLCNKVEQILSDGQVTSNEQEELKAIFNDLINPIENLKKEIIVFENKAFCLTGDFEYGPKSSVAEYIVSKGGIIHDKPKKATNYVVVGGYGSSAYSNGTYGTKVKKAIEMGICVIKEEDLFK